MTTVNLILPDIKGKELKMEPASLMEKQALLYTRRKRSDPFTFLPSTEKEVREELKRLKPILLSLSGDMRVVRKELSLLEKKFTLLGKYKYELEKTLTPVTLVAPRKVKGRKKEKSEEEMLLERIQQMSPEEQVKLKGL